MSAHCTVLVTVLEGPSFNLGRNFMKSSHSQLYMQCRLNNEILTTDPVAHAPSPIWDTELAWDIQPKTLSFLRSQRTSLKLVCFTLDQNNEREPLGYIMLELRSALQGSPPYVEKWYPLNNIHNTSAFRPEIKLVFAVTNTRDRMPDGVNPSARVERQPKKAKPPAAKVVEPVYTGHALGLKTDIGYTLSNDGYYQIGTQDSQCRFFTLWITIAFAEHLNSLSDGLNDPDGYYFYYSFLGNDILTHRFYHLDDPNFPAERVAIRFRTRADNLQVFLDQMKMLTIQLCTDKATLAWIEIPLNITVGESMSLMEQVHPLNCRVPLPPSTKSPSIGISVALSLENQPPASPASHISRQLDPNAQNTSPPRRALSPNRVESPTHPTRQSPWHQFRFSIELRSIRNSRLDATNVFFTYTYTAFGSNSPFSTTTSQISKTPREHILPHSFCAYEFVMSAHKLESYLKGLPLKIEMWQRGENTQNSLLGHAQVDLSRVMESHKKKVSEPRILTIQTSDVFVDITPANIESYAKVGELRVVLALEDFGCVDETNGVNETLQPRTPGLPIPSDYPANEKYAPSAADTSIHDTQEYKVAMELEVWRQEEQAKFRLLLQEKEKLLNAKLCQEWKSREEERERVLKKKLGEYRSLESQLEVLSSQLESREQALYEAEQLFEKRRSNNELETNRTLNESRDAARRLSEEYKHKAEMERQRTAEAESKRDTITKEKDVLSAEYKALEREFYSFRKSINQTSDSLVEANLAKAVAKSAELQSELAESQEKLQKVRAKLVRVYKAYSSLKQEKKHEYKQTNQLVSQQTALEEIRQTIKQVVDSNAVKVESETVAKPVTPQQQAQIERLEQERNSLLDTGIYAKSDGLIRQLDARIQSLKV